MGVCPTITAKYAWNDTRAMNAIKLLSELCDVPLEEQIRISGRILATSLAYRTQPFGDDLDAKKKGEGAVTRDIWKVYTIPSIIYDKIKAKGDLHLSKVWYKAYRDKDMAKCKEILDKLGIEVNLMPNFDGGTAHRAARINGKVRQKQPTQLVFVTADLRKYDKEVQSHVGTAKSAFIEAGEMATGLDSGRVPRWWIRNKKGNGTGSLVNQGTKIAVTLVSNLPYASYALTFPERMKALKIAVDGMETGIKKMLEDGAKKIMAGANRA